MNKYPNQGKGQNQTGNSGQKHSQPVGGQGNKPSEEPINIQWHDSEGRVHIDLFSNTAEKWAKQLSEGKNKEKNKLTQIRGFYDELLRIQNMVGKNEKKYKDHLPYLLMLRSKVYYSNGRKLVDKDFVRIMDQGLEISRKGLKNFEIFVRFFESFLGYFKYYNEQPK